MSICQLSWYLVANDVSGARISPIIRFTHTSPFVIEKHCFARPWLDTVLFLPRRSVPCTNLHTYQLCTRHYLLRIYLWSVYYACPVWRFYNLGLELNSFFEWNFWSRSEHVSNEMFLFIDTNLFLKCDEIKKESIKKSFNLVVKTGYNSWVHDERFFTGLTIKFLVKIHFHFHYQKIVFPWNCCPRALYRYNYAWKNQF